MVLILILVVLNYNDSQTTIGLLRIAEDYNVIDHIIIVDNMSTDNSLDLLKEYESSKIKIICSDKNGGYGYGNNYGVKYAIEHFNADYVLICNPDVYFPESTVKACLSTLQTFPDAAVVAPRMINRNGEKNPKCAWKLGTWIEYLLSPLVCLRWILPNAFYSFDSIQKNILQVDAVAGSMLMINANHFSIVGMYDENIFLYCEETVLGIKLKRAGLKSYLILNEYFIHYHSMSINKSINTAFEKRKILWQSRLFVLKTYYGCTKIQMLFSKLIMCLSLIEALLFTIIIKSKSIFTGK